MLICGGRDYTNADVIGGALATYASGRHTLVCGGARGADAIAAEIARVRGWTVEEHRADWNKWGKRAGPIRNEEMVRAGADICLSFPGGRGTEDCAHRAERAGIPVVQIGPSAHRQVPSP